MKCPSCKASLKVRASISGDGKQSRLRACPECGKVFHTVEILQESSFHFRVAQATAKRLQRSAEAEEV